VGEALILSRLLQFASVIVVFGCGAFRVYGLGGDTLAAFTGALAAFDAWFRRVTIVGAIVALLSALTLLLAVTANMAGSAAAALDPDTISAVLFDTSFGRVWCWHLLFAVLLIGASLAPLPRWRMTAILVLSLLLLISLGWVGHAAMDQGAAKLGHELNQMVHLIAAGLWLGGLVPLAWFLAQARHRSSSGLDFPCSRRAAAVLAHGICRGCATRRHRRNQCSSPGRQFWSARPYALRSTAESQDPVVLAYGRSCAD
jgi:putative copper resistance protein D